MLLLLLVLLLEGGPFASSASDARALVGGPQLLLLLLLRRRGRRPWPTVVHGRLPSTVVQEWPAVWPSILHMAVYSCAGQHLTPGLGPPPDCFAPSFARE